MTEIPLFPLRSVLCPGVALPLHIFEERYRLMIDRCIERGEPFGVVLIRDGGEVGPLSGEFATIGTTATIRRAGKYPDGRLDILTVGQQRFRLESVDSVSQPYLIGRVEFLAEPTGPAEEAREQAARIGHRFLEYLELLQPEGGEDGPEIEIEFEIEVDEDDDEAADAAQASDVTEPAGEYESVRHEESVEGASPPESADPLVQEMDAAELSPEQRREVLMAAARRLTGTVDPTSLSYVLTALIQIDLASRQQLLEAADTVERLQGLGRLLSRETWFLRQGLRPIIIDPAQPQQRDA